MKAWNRKKNKKHIEQKWTKFKEVNFDTQSVYKHTDVEPKKIKEIIDKISPLSK